MRRHPHVLLLVALVAAGAMPLARQAAPGGTLPPSYALAEPGISPDGREIAFTSGGDVWVVPAAGGDAHLLVADAANDRRPLYSPDGRHLAFVSTRTGGGDIYVLTFSTGRVRRVTWDDGLEQLDGWSRDSGAVFFSSTSRDVAGMNDIFRIGLDGGTAVAVTEERYVNEFGAAASPDGRQIAFAARGIASNQWWRRGSSHIDQSELWTVTLTGSPAYTQLTPRGARQLWPMWSADSRTLFYVSDRGGAENVWSRPAAASVAPRAPVATNGASDTSGRPLTAFRDGRVLWPSITADGRTIAFERDFGVWTLDTGSGQARQLSIVRRGAPTTSAPERLRQTAQFTDLALAPDGRKVAFIARGDVFAGSAKDSGDATRVTSSPEIESQPVWTPDSRKIAYASARGAGQQIYLYDFTTATERPITRGTTTDLSPVFSPDGKSMAFLRDRRELRVVDVESGAERLLATGTFADTIDDPKPAWSPDGRWIALFSIGAKAFTNVDLVAVAGGAPPRPVSFLANVFTNSVVWSRDGTYLLFDTRQRTESGQLARVDLTLRTPKFREDLFRDLFTPATTPGTKPAESKPAESKPAEPVEGRPPVFANIRERLSLVPIGLDVSDVTISPDGKTAAVIAAAAGQTNIYTYSLDELATDRPVARQVSTSTGAKANPQFTPDNREIYFLDAGRIQIAAVATRDVRPLALTAEFTVDFASEKLQVFQQAWTLLRDNFFDAGFNGVNWEASRERYGQRVAAAATGDELRRIVSLMIGDLNASHLGISAAAGGGPVVGRLGLRFARAAYESGGRLTVDHVVPLGPAALTQSITAGDTIVAVDGRRLDRSTNLDELLANTIDRRVVLSVARASGETRDVVIRPTNQATEKSLLYRQWVETNREYVLKASGGRLGYVHMINMSAAALEQLHLDLDVENHKLDGVVVDLRNNNGGFVNAYAIDVFARQPYLRMSTRSVPEAPARTVLGQRALESATVLVTNQHSLSDAEDFTEGYRTLKLGPVVGEPTAGWIIYTWDARLVDGSTLRLPRMRIKAADGQDMEMHPRSVDVAVVRPLGEFLAGRDTQLDEAVKVLLKKLGRAE